MSFGMRRSSGGRDSVVLSMLMIEMIPHNVWILPHILGRESEKYGKVRIQMRGMSTYYENKQLADSMVLEANPETLPFHSVPNYQDDSTPGSKFQPVTNYEIAPSYQSSRIYRTASASIKK